MRDLFLKFLAFGVVASLSMVASPDAASAQAQCGACLSSEVCDYGGQPSECWWYPECVTRHNGCREQGGDAEDFALADVRTVETEAGLEVIARVSEEYFGRWQSCDGKVTRLWRETPMGLLLPVVPEEVGVRVHPSFAAVTADAG